MNNPNHRAVEIAGFLAQHGWDDAMQAPFAADFSPRRYARLVKDDGSRAVLMDADPDQKTESFVIVDEFLCQIGLSVPEIFAVNIDAGLMLLEDFGGRNFGNLVDQGNDTPALYRRGVDVLIHLHKNCDRAALKQLDLPAFGGALFASQVEMFLDYYFPYANGREASMEEGESFRAAWKQALKGIDGLPQSLLLRDYMPDNLMDLPKRTGVQSVGLLDFQDAGSGPSYYDLASFCEVVRRDGGDALLPQMISYYHQQMKPEQGIPEITAACNLLAAQRHVRILGVIARLAHKMGPDRKPEKLAYIPRIWNYLDQLLRADALTPVRSSVQQYMAPHERVL